MTAPDGLLQDDLRIDSSMSYLLHFSLHSLFKLKTLLIGSCTFSLSKLTGCLHIMYAMFYRSVQPLTDLVAPEMTTHGEQATKDSNGSFTTSI